MQTRRTRRLAATVLTSLIVLTTSPAPQAHADPLFGITCSLGTFDVRFDPGITLDEQDVLAQTEYVYTNCISAAHPDISAGFVNYTNLLPGLTCVNLGDPRFGFQHRITWSNGITSTVVVDEIIVGGLFTRTGIVTKGLFKGKNFTLTAQTLTLDVTRCLTPQGLTTVTGIVLNVDITSR